jgi:hypothetical protein
VKIDVDEFLEDPILDGKIDNDIKTKIPSGVEIYFTKDPKTLA